MKFFTNFKMLLVAVGLAMGAMSVNAAGYTRTLSENLTVAGYQLKAFYDFQNNTPAVLPTEGDLRYRPYEKGGYWGLHNFGSNGRSATVSIPVAATDILVIQEYNSELATTINRGSENANLTASTGYRVFDITTTADDVTFTVPRNAGIVAALVMKKDASVQTANYAINYQLNGNTIKTFTGTEVIGETVSAESAIWAIDPADGLNTKFVVEDGQTTSMTIAASGNELNVSVKIAALYTYTVSATDGQNTIGVLGNGRVYEGESATVRYPQYILKDGSLYNTATATSGDWYAITVTPTKDDEVYEVAYNNGNPIADVVFYTEGEDINGASAGTNTARASKGQMGHTGGADKYLDVTTLEAGKYKIFWRGVNGNNDARAFNFKAGDNIIYNGSIDNGINVTGNSEEISIASATTLSLACAGSSASGMDWFYIVKTGDVATSVNATIGQTGYTTFASEYALDVTGVGAYYVAEVGAESVTLTEATGTVAAGTGLLLKGEANAEVTIPVVASGEELSDNKLVGCVAETVLDVNADYYVMVSNEGTAEFQRLDQRGATIPAGKAYLNAGNAGARLSIVFGDTNSISSVKDSTVSGEVYNLQGQRVEKATKGLYIVGGKKVVMK